MLNRPLMMSDGNMGCPHEEGNPEDQAETGEESSEE